MASQCNCIGIIDSTFENNLGIGLVVKLTQGNCEGGDLPYPPLFNLSAIAGNGDSYLNQYMQDTILGWSTSVDIRSTAFKGNVDFTFLQGIETEAMATALRGGAGLNIQSSQRIMLVDVHFDGNMAWQGGALLLDSCLAIVIWGSTFTQNLATLGGGAVASVNNVHLGDLFIGNTSAIGNTALTGGSVYGADQASIIIGNDTVFDGNHAIANGGAIACVECASLTVQDQVVMQMNHADAAGGALYADSSSATQLTATRYYGNWYDHLSPDMLCLLSDVLQCQAEAMHKQHVVICKYSKSVDVAGLSVAACVLQGCRRWCCVHCRTRSSHCVSDQLHEQYNLVKCRQPHICWGGVRGWWGCVF